MSVGTSFMSEGSKMQEAVRGVATCMHNTMIMLPASIATSDNSNSTHAFLRNAVVNEAHSL